MFCFYLFFCLIRPKADRIYSPVSLRNYSDPNLAGTSCSVPGSWTWLQYWWGQILIEERVYYCLAGLWCMSPSSHSLSGTYMTTLFVTKCRYLLCKSFSFSLQEHAGAIESWEDKVRHYLHQSFGLLPRFCILGSGSFLNLKTRNRKEMVFHNLINI